MLSISSTHQQDSLVINLDGRIDANSAKEHRRQIEVAADVAEQIAGGDRRVVGVMIESHLNEGRQDIVAGQPLRHGVSVTDACIGFEQTVPVLENLAAAVRARRAVSR